MLELLYSPHVCNPVVYLNAKRNLYLQKMLSMMYCHSVFAVVHFHFLIENMTHDAVLIKHSLLLFSYVNNWKKGNIYMHILTQGEIVYHLP